MSFTDGADEESPITETDRSEPKTGTTIASYSTDASSPISPTQMEAVFSVDKVFSREIKGEISNTIGSEVEPKYSLLNFAFLGEGSRKKPNFGFIDAQYPCEDYTRMEREKAQSSRWQDRETAFGLMASTPEFGPLPLKIVEIAKVCHGNPPKEPLIMAGTKSAYNPLAVEWCPSTQRNSIGPEEKPQIQIDWPQTNVTVRSPLSVETTGRIQCAQTVKGAENGQHIEISKGQFDFLRKGWFETPASLAITPVVVGDAQNRPVENPGQDGVCATQRRIATLKQIGQLDKKTLAQRRAERNFANEHIRFSQLTLTTVQTPPASLLMTQEPAEFNIAASGQSPSTPAVQHRRPYPVAHKQFATLKRPRSDLNSVPVHPELIEWHKMEQDLLRTGLVKRMPGKPDGGSFVVPKNFEQWLEFQAGRTEDLLLENAAKIHRKRAEVEAATRAHQIFLIDAAHNKTSISQEDARDNRIGPPIDGKEFRDGRCTVLAQPSTWSRWYEPTEERPEALWPCIEEMKEEGDERHTSGFGRYLPLPRVPGNPTVVWKVKPMIPALPFDEIWKIPNKDTWAELHSRKPENSEEEYMKAMIGRALLEAINC